MTNAIDLKSGDGVERCHELISEPERKRVDKLKSAVGRIRIDEHLAEQATKHLTGGHVSFPCGGFECHHLPAREQEGQLDHFCVHDSGTPVIRHSIRHSHAI